LLRSWTGKEDNGLPIVGIPSLLRDLTNGQRSVSVEGDTVRQVIDHLEELYPGIKERLCEEDRLRPSIAVVVDGQPSTLKLRHRLQESSEVHFVISISGGRS
jgi:molybdopterin synthase sulfur carrier subunit